MVVSTIILFQTLLQTLLHELKQILLQFLHRSFIVVNSRLYLLKHHCKKNTTKLDTFVKVKFGKFVYLLLKYTYIYS